MGDKIKREKKILIITSGAFPYNTPSANLIRLLSVGLYKNNFDVKVMVQYGKEYNRNKDIILDKKKGSISGVTFRYCGFIESPKGVINKGIDSFISNFNPLLIIFKRAIKNDLDFVIMHNNYFHEAIFILFLCKIFKIKIIHFQVDLFDNAWFNRNISNSIMAKIKSLNNNLRYNYLLSYFDGAMTISSYLKKHFSNMLKTEKKVFLFPHITEIKVENSIYNEKTLESDTVIIGALGPLNEDNGIDNLIKILQILRSKNKNVFLKLIGGPTLEITHYKKYANLLNVEQYIDFCGHIDTQKIQHYLKGCDILALLRPSSLYNNAGFPTKLGEYFACMKPIVITDYGDIHVYFQDKQNLMLAKSGNIDSMTEKFLFLINNPIKAREIAQNGYNWSKENQDYIKTTLKLGDFLKKLK